jgi:SAM-dependent methyltransferase
VASRYDDELWELVPEDPGPPPEHLRRFVRGLGRAEHALDLGCGDGRLTYELDAAALTAADVSAVALERAGRRLADRGAELVELEPDAPLPLPDSTYDLVLCAETLEHARDVQLLLSEARRVLRPGGRFAITTPALGRRTALRALLRGFEREVDPLSPHVRFFTPRSLRRTLVEMGFEVESLERRHGSACAVAAR